MRLIFTFWGLAKTGPYQLLCNWTQDGFRIVSPLESFWWIHEELRRLSRPCYKVQRWKWILSQQSYIGKTCVANNITASMLWYTVHVHFWTPLEYCLCIFKSFVKFGITVTKFYIFQQHLCLVDTCFFHSLVVSIAITKSDWSTICTRTRGLIY